MAHKTLVDSTEYEVTGGLTLVEGTSYSIKNGKVFVDSTEYDISFVLPPDVLKLWYGSGTYNYIKCITYANGYWVVGGQYNDGDTYCARIAYTTNLDGTWTTQDLWTGINEYTSINGITYANGSWVVAGQCYNSSNCCAQIAYTTSPDGTWTTKILWSGSAGEAYTNTINCIIYANGYWVVGGQYYYRSSRYPARIAWATSPDGTWNIVNILGGTSIHTINCITYANGYWVVGGHITSSNTYYARLAYATDIEQVTTWTPVQLWYDSSSSYTAINCITYANGYWVVGGEYYEDATNTYYARISYATDLEDTWTTQDLWGDKSVGNCIYCITYANGQLVVGGVGREVNTFYSRIAYTTSPDATWVTTNVWSGSNAQDGIMCIDDINGYWVAGGRIRVADYVYGQIAYAESLTELGQTS